ncbi:ethanolamine utilization protein EutH, partial [Candidatus Hakubella thermalkaliphila]|uniref:ethanolamine utilization protein EutH n=1 Tax=Candidatus Hakubella thermalkaliphila TaxID=2754717 RepID=UPI0015941AA8
MDINVIIIFIMAVFVLLGALDRILVQVNEKWKIPVISGMGARFEDGFNAMGPLALAMVGVISLAPVLANILRPVVVPVYGFLLADPAMFATTLLANDMGGYPLAMKLALTEDAGRYAGLILGAMMGPPIVFTIPVALGIIRREDR